MKMSRTYPPINLPDFFEDPDSPLSFSVAVDPAALIDASIAGDQLQLTAAADEFGSGSVTVTATGDGESVTSVLSLTVTSQPDPPEVTDPLGTLTVQEDQATIADINLDDHFTDRDGDALSYSFTESASGVITTTLSGSSLSFQTLPDVNGDVTITVTANNAEGPPVSDSLLVRVLEVNDPPVRTGTPSPVVFDEDQASSLPTIDLDNFYTDPDSPDLIYTIESNTPNGRVGASINDSILSFSPEADQNGSVTLEISASDGSTTAPGRTTVDVTINPINDAPRIATPLEDIAIGEDSSSPNPVNLQSAFVDVDGDTLSYSDRFGDTTGRDRRCSFGNFDSIPDLSRCKRNRNYYCRGDRRRHRCGTGLFPRRSNTSA